MVAGATETDGDTLAARHKLAAARREPHLAEQHPDHGLVGLLGRPHERRALLDVRRVAVRADRAHERLRAPALSPAPN